jgi:hypothetical protein
MIKQDKGGKTMYHAVEWAREELGLPELVKMGKASEFFKH